MGCVRRQPRERVHPSTDPAIGLHRRRVIRFVEGDGVVEAPQLDGRMVVPGHVVRRRSEPSDGTVIDLKTHEDVVRVGKQLDARGAVDLAAVHIDHDAARELA
jgi:hypothetical protein